MRDKRSALRRVREAKGLRPAHLAVAANITEGQIRNLEAGRSRPTLDTAQRLSAALGEPVDVLFPPAADVLVARAGSAA